MNPRYKIAIVRRKFMVVPYIFDSNYFWIVYVSAILK
jgi:hypothetical protein